VVLGRAYLTLVAPDFVIAIGATKCDFWATSRAGNASPLREVLFSLLPTDLDLLFFSSAPQLIWLECVLGLELCTTMFRDVSFRHLDRVCERSGI